MTTEGVLKSKSIFDKCCLELKNTLENMWGGTNIWNFEVWPLSHRTLTPVFLLLSQGYPFSRWRRRFPWTRERRLPPHQWRWRRRHRRDQGRSWGEGLARPHLTVKLVLPGVWEILRLTDHSGLKEPERNFLSLTIKSKLHACKYLVKYSLHKLSLHVSWT